MWKVAVHLMQRYHYYATTLYLSYCKFYRSLICPRKLFELVSAGCRWSTFFPFTISA